VTMRNAVFCDVAPFGFIINRRFGGTCRFHLQGRRNNTSDCLLPTNTFPRLRYFFYPEVGGDTFLRNVGL
jgi:hypothetical protein